ncbi:toxin [Candidatus Saccharibacteria bacterium]|nr:toxin [Candidatus Saccharibacteria bacterium]
MAFDISFNEEKNQLLKATRCIGFDEIILAIKTGDLLDDIIHISQKYPHQRVYVVRIRAYVYAVPYVINPKTKEVFLKTAYPSRILKHKYIQGDNHE